MRTYIRAYREQEPLFSSALRGDVKLISRATTMTSIWAIQKQMYRVVDEVCIITTMSMLMHHVS
jgi:hypothetical protein